MRDILESIEESLIKDSGKVKLKKDVKRLEGEVGKAHRVMKDMSEAELDSDKPDKAKLAAMRTIQGHLADAEDLLAAAWLKMRKL